MLRKKFTFIIKLLGIVILIPILSILTGCQARSPFFYDFETEASLDALYWRCKTIFALSDKHVTSGQKCLKLELYPSLYPGIGLGNFNPDWSEYDFLRFDVYNDEKFPLRLTIHIDDTKDSAYYNRDNKTVTLNPGSNHIAISLNSLVTPGANRNLNLSKIVKVALFLLQPKEKRTLYLDNMRLE